MCFYIGVPGGVPGVPVVAVTGIFERIGTLFYIVICK